MRVFVYIFVYAHIWFDDSEVGWWLRLLRWSGGGKRVGVGSANPLTMEGGWFVKVGVGSANILSMGREGFAVDLGVRGVVEFAYEI